MEALNVKHLHVHGAPGVAPGTTAPPLAHCKLAQHKHFAWHPQNCADVVVGPQQFKLEHVAGISG